MLRFHDPRRGDAALAGEYGRLKRQLAARYPDARSAYTDGKSVFVERILAS
jgi:GrpB-like predicted nucleotidyltransferase (UPF0157 family)